MLLQFAITIVRLLKLQIRPARTFYYLLYVLQGSMVSLPAGSGLEAAVAYNL
jgi:hypothetical protein